MSLPSGTVAMEFGSCEVCVCSGDPIGINCTCGKHFHVGESLIVGTDPIFCPRCEGASIAVDIAGERQEPIDVGELSEEQLIDQICAELDPAVAKGIRKVAASRRNPDPQFWTNVTLREQWRHEHGSYDGWDEAVRAQGVEPAQFGPA